ncbi:hypothetical protein MMC10_007825 [Thelotrema lepadinum]|nr:hypothetical protein [Thelotrema lepadinum]
MDPEILSSPSSDSAEDRLDLPVELELNKTGETTKVRGERWKARILKQGPWDQKCAPKMLSGLPALPMPIQITAPSIFAPFFHHLECNGDNTVLPDQAKETFEDASEPVLDKEPYYEVPLIEYDKGVVYADRRMDLCKMGVGPLNINALMDSLDNNTFIKHFLFGNNIIGPAGARRIARFIQDHPDRMDTWYLAGNCLNHASFLELVDSLINSVASNIWLKRNPLTAASAPHIARLIRRSRHLHTLDLDMTELGNDGVTSLFDALLAFQVDNTEVETPISLRHLYLNANGIGLEAAASISRFLRSPICGLESLYLSNNPIGDAGATVLSSGLVHNTTLKRLMLSSIGLTSAGAIPLLEALQGHQTLVALDLGQSYATEDLDTRFNWISDTAATAVEKFVKCTPSLRYFVIDYNAFTYTALNQILKSAVIDDGANRNICWFEARNVVRPDDKTNTKAAQINHRFKRQVKKQLHENVGRLYDGMNYQEFDAKERRKLFTPMESVRQIDSVYRNRDAGMARRGLKFLDKLWSEGDGTLEEVMAS